MKHTLRILIATCIFANTIILTSCNKEEPVNPKGTVKYVIDSSKTGMFITYYINGKTFQKEIINDKWSESFSAFKGDYVYLGASSPDPNSSISVKIYWKGNIFKSSSDSGTYPSIYVAGTLD